MYNCDPANVVPTTGDYGQPATPGRVGKIPRRPQVRVVPTHGTPVIKEPLVDKFLIFTIVGLSTAAIYAVIASGLVLTYTTTGVFNFAHGATGMLAAFAYWQLRVELGLADAAGPADGAAACWRPRSGSCSSG